MEALDSTSVANVVTASDTEQDESDWIKSPVANLYKYKPSGKYYCRAKVHGHQIRKSLKTRSFEIAQIKIAKLLSEERARLAQKPDEELSFADLVKEYRARLEARVDMKPRSRAYRIETINPIRANWPDADKLMPRDFTEDAVLALASKIRKKCSASRYNGVIQTLRGILQVAVDKGLLFDNPAKAKKRNSTRGVPSAPVPLNPPELPENDKFQELLKHLDAVPERKRGARMVRFLAFSGQRIGAVRQIMPQHIDMEKNQLIVPAIKYDPFPRRIPMIPELRKLAEELLKDYPGEGPLLQIANPRKALKHACEDAKIAPLTNHDLRHVFTTRCIEAGVDIRTIAHFLGHKDGGRLLLRLYSHVLDKHAQEMAAKVSFGPQANS